MSDLQKSSLHLHNPADESGDPLEIEGDKLYLDPHNYMKKCNDN